VSAVGEEMTYSLALLSLGLNLTYPQCTAGPFQVHSDPDTREAITSPEHETNILGHDTNTYCLLGLYEVTCRMSVSHRMSTCGGLGSTSFSAPLLPLTISDHKILKSLCHEIPALCQCSGAIFWDNSP
jgi:hypothetical protein